MRTCFIALAILCICLTGRTATSAEAEKLRVAYINYPPFNYPSDGEASGIAVDLVREVCARLGLEPVFIQLPFARLLYEMRAGEVDCAANVYWSAERSKYLYYVPFSFIQEEMAVYVKKGSGLQVETVDDLVGHAVGAVRGYHYGEGVLEKLGSDVVFVKDSHTLYKMLTEGRFDVALGNRYGGAAVLNEIGSREKVFIAFSLAREPFYVAFSRKMGDRGKTLARHFAQEMEAIAKERGMSMDE